uniref:Uncharacterized protein n=1 Tax=Arundo donax TaxID=35708 RepID=A0A0A9A2D3_ARUDO
MMKATELGMKCQRIATFLFLLDYIPLLYSSSPQSTQRSSYPLQTNNLSCIHIHTNTTSQ